MKKYFRSFTNAIKYFINKGYNLDFNQHITALLQSKFSVDAVYKFDENHHVETEDSTIYAITINNIHRGIYVDRQQSDENHRKIVQKINEALTAA
ncbi:MAG: hypothetical protein KTR13_09285 [Saprospiraceae bacterium]|nr:hypothetical protein [Saprospiraceae bacterium]